MLPWIDIIKQRRSIFRFMVGGILLAALFSPAGLFAVESAGTEASSAELITTTFLWIAVILIAAKVSSLIERVGQPAVLGELLIGVALGSVYLFGFDLFEPIKTNGIIHFLAELGVVILLFQIGMESSVQTMMKVGIPSFLVATVGVVMPMVVIAYIAGPLLVPGLSSAAYLFLGATMTATSVGITARVLKDLGKSDTSEARIIIGAAVIDDVMGLIILAVVSAIVLQGSINIATLSIIIIKATVFLGGGIVVGTWLAPRLSSLFARVHTGTGMKFAVVISFGLVFAYLASLMGLAPIVGAFTAGLILTPVYFTQYSDPHFIDDLKETIKGEELNGSLSAKISGLIETHSHRQIIEFTEHLGHFLVPIFFVLTGMQVKVASLLDTRIIVMSLGILVVAMLTKVAAGIVAGKGMNKLAVGIGMMPRGEVGLIFANMGKGMGVMDDAVFSAIVVVIMLTTLLTPPLLAAVLKRA